MDGLPGDRIGHIVRFTMMNNIAPVKLLDITELNLEYERLADKVCRVVIYPLPPCPVSGLIYHPKGFHPKTLESGYDRPDCMKIIATKFTKYGPAILIDTKFRELIDYHNGVISCGTGVCATSSSYIEDDVAYDSILDRIVVINRSCHPGSHITVPNAPYLTTLLHHSSVSRIGESRGGSIEYTDPSSAENDFPGVSFNNRKFDKLISHAYADANYYANESGIGPWAIPYIKKMTLNGKLRSTATSNTLTFYERTENG